MAIKNDPHVFRCTVCNKVISCSRPVARGGSLGSNKPPSRILLLQKSSQCNPLTNTELYLQIVALAMKKFELARSRRAWLRRVFKKIVINVSLDYASGMASSMARTRKRKKNPCGSSGGTSERLILRGRLLRSLLIACYQIKLLTMDSSLIAVLNQ